MSDNDKVSKAGLDSKAPELEVTKDTKQHIGKKNTF